MSVGIETVSGMPGDSYRTTRRRSEAELLTYEEASAKTSKYVQQLSLNEEAIEELRMKYLTIGLNQCPESIESEMFSSQTLPPRRSSLSVLEERHLNKAKMYGALSSETEKARRARRKSFEKLRKRSTEDKSKKERKPSAS